LRKPKRVDGVHTSLRRAPLAVTRIDDAARLRVGGLVALFALGIRQIGNVLYQGLTRTRHSRWTILKHRTTID